MLLYCFYNSTGSEIAVDRGVLSVDTTCVLLLLVEPQKTLFAEIDDWEKTLFDEKCLCRNCGDHACTVQKEDTRTPTAVVADGLYGQTLACIEPSGC